MLDGQYHTERRQSLSTRKKKLFNKEIIPVGTGKNMSPSVYVICLLVYILYVS